MQKSAAIPLPPKATVPFFYKYSSLPTPEHVERLRVIMQEHELYLPSLPLLNDPTDGRPRLASLSEEQMSSFIYTKLVRRSPDLSPAELARERAIIIYNVKLHGTETLLRMLTESLYSELEGYRVYSMSKRYDNLSLWAKYAGDHSGYCLEFVNEGPLFDTARDVMYKDSLRMDVNNPEHTNGFWFFCKRPEWSNEEEVRMVLPRGHGSKVKFDPRWLKRLILGRNISEENEQTIRAWASQRTPTLAVVKARYDAIHQTISRTLGPQPTVPRLRLLIRLRMQLRRGRPERVHIWRLDVLDDRDRRTSASADLSVGNDRACHVRREEFGSVLTDQLVLSRHHASASGVRNHVADAVQESLPEFPRKLPNCLSRLDRI